MMLAHFRSSILLKISRRRFILPVARGCIAYLDKLKSPSMQMSGQQLCFAAFHEHASTVRERDLRTLLQFPIVEMPLWLKIQIKFSLGKSFDHLQFCTGAMVTLAFLTDLIKQGATAQVEELHKSHVIAPGAYKCVLHHITHSLHNPGLTASEMVVKESDVVEIRLDDLHFLKAEDSAPRFQTEYRNSTIACLETSFKYMPNFEEKLEEQFCSESKQNDKMDVKALKSMQTKVVKTFEKSLNQYDISFLRPYADYSFNNPIGPWKCSKLWFKGRIKQE